METMIYFLGGIIMKKFIKPMIIGAGIYGLCEFSCQIGKAYMLGLSSAYNYNADETIDILNNSNRFMSKFIGKTAKIFKE